MGSGVPGLGDSHGALYSKRAQKVQPQKDTKAQNGFEENPYVLFVPFCSCLQIGCVEGIALANVSGFVASLEPAQTLFRRAVSEGIRNDVSSRPALNLIVADRTRSS